MQSSLFVTSSETAGYRLQYMEVFNWGTFDGQVFRIAPQGNNSLLTGANASGKSTFIDALLTLMVPVKRNRFYNQSSGVEKKGDRTEKTYVLGHYGNIQREGEAAASVQALRGANTYSVILASFSNTDQKEITLFQVRWFSNGELKRAFGIAHVPLTITADFANFDGKGHWRKRLSNKHNDGGPKKKIEFMDGPTSYAERLSSLFGMRSVKALSLFNQIVGVKVLDDLDEFVRTNMLEEADAEKEFVELKQSFVTLMDAKNNIEKAKEQIERLKPIDEMASALENLTSELAKQKHSKQLGVYWFAQKYVALATEELLAFEKELEQLNNELTDLRKKESALKDQESSLAVDIKMDETGNRIEQLKNDIAREIAHRERRKNNLDDYNRIVQKIGLTAISSLPSFEGNHPKVLELKNDAEAKIESTNEKIRLLNNRKDERSESAQTLVETIQTLQKNKNNISGRVSQIREEILAHTGASKAEMPFIGELISVKNSELDWRSSIEKLLHHFALRLIVPEKYYKQVNRFVNRQNLRGRIVYQRYRGFTPLNDLSVDQVVGNALINKLKFKKESDYTEWAAQAIRQQYNYACVDDLEEFNRYDEKAVTKEGLVKHVKGRHEKDDRAHILRPENYVLGWDNKQKIAELKKQLNEIHQSQKTTEEELFDTKKVQEQYRSRRDDCNQLQNRFRLYEDLDWQSCAVKISEMEAQKLELEKTNNRVKTLQDQLEKVRASLKKLSETTMPNKNRKIFRKEQKVENIQQEKKKNEQLITGIGEVDVTTFEGANLDLQTIDFKTFAERQRHFQKENTEKIVQLEKDINQKERSLMQKINDFKRPPEQIERKFPDWRSDVNRLPEPNNLDLVSEYQELLDKLETDNLPKFETKWNNLLQTTITDKIASFRIFFTDWADSIKQNIRHLNESLKAIDFNPSPATYIQLVAATKRNEEVTEFRKMLDKAIPNIRELDTVIDGRKHHFVTRIEPLIRKLDDEKWRSKVMEVRSWFRYRAEEFYKSDDTKFKTYENMGSLSGGEKAQLTYTILGSAIAYQFGLTKEGLQTNSFRFIAIDEAFKAQDEDKAKYLLSLCQQLHLQLLVVTPLDNLHVVENNISFIHFVERKEEKYSWLYDMPIEQFKNEKATYTNS